MSLVQKVDRIVKNSDDLSRGQSGYGSSDSYNERRRFDDGDLSGTKSSLSNPWLKETDETSGPTFESQTPTVIVAERIVRKFRRASYGFEIETLRHYCWMYTDSDFQAAIEMLTKNRVIRVEGGRAHLATASDRVRRAVA